MGWLDKALSDAVQVVRCKECKHYEPYCDGSVIGVCKINPMGKMASAHYYCASGAKMDGERREE